MMKDLNEIQDAKRRLEESNTHIGTAYVPAPKPKLDLYSGIGTAYVPAPRSKLDRYAGIGTAYVPAPKSKLDIYSGIGTVHVPAPKPKLDLYSGIGTAYVPAPRSKLDRYAGIGTAYVPAPKSKLDKYSGIGTTYVAPKPELKPIQNEIIDEAQSHLIDLLRNIPVQELARKLKIGHMKIQNYLENREMISLDIAKKLRFLWAIEFGTSYFPGQKSDIDEPLECSVFDNVYKFVGDNKKYKISNVKDVLPKKIEESQYDGALKRVMPQINDILYTFFKKELEIEETQELSFGITAVCPEYRKFEIEIIDNDAIQYYFIYGKGMIVDCSESLRCGVKG